MTLADKLHDPALGHSLVMGILNVTPDSFSDGGQFNSMDALKQQIEKMSIAGADIIDIGGESTRPGAQEISLQEELDRVLPAIEAVKEMSDVYISIDTYKPEVMKESIQLKVDMINDVNALQAKGAIEVVREADVVACLMHKQGHPKDMQQSPEYEEGVFEAVYQFLSKQSMHCLDEGIKSENIVIDPGFGFGKKLPHNVELFERLEEFSSLQYPLLVGVSRKTMIGELLDGAPVDDRVVGSVSAAVLASMKGAKILRVHDVKETVEAVKIAMALL
ncbi:dihydropteroate synthase [Hydrogenovibrio sp. 3SP14C1]|uniref:dihydropteroate synthase n=1 Tax=Hydrogenovibrio sp. 3SP14C1 TaxID=3038774 RepID=UPI0024173064|nr:dihydropteroate synthase [Hydrogenovibrio sp. 3SP14C1]MDG4813167.1 dihydropteroate synthase [Hydrogenovibrio sp. 3SP14C1]